MPNHKPNLQRYRRRSGNGTERSLNHLITEFWEKPTGSNHHQTINATNSEVTSQAKVLVSIATTKLPCLVVNSLRPEGHASHRFKT